MTIGGCQENIKTELHKKKLYERDGETIKCSRQINCVKMFYCSTSALKKFSIQKCALSVQYCRF